MKPMVSTSLVKTCRCHRDLLTRIKGISTYIELQRRSAVEEC